ncbi:MAG TPA: methyltransferase domain-containing protein [Ilumatobacteraceae bacterium]|nr:methyltransferase domain-containing protein [Ilumatobacteraceae bacterium]
MNARDAMEFINEQDDATVQRFVDRLEFRGRDPVFVGYRETYVDKMALDDSADIVEIGCGTGVVARALASRGGFSGRVIGIEQSPALVEVANRLAAEDGVGDRIEFRVGDIHALDFPDASVDAVIAHTTMSHVTDPAAVLAEAARVLRAGGTFAAFDGDYASWTFGYGDPIVAKAMEDALIAAIVSKPRVMRDMPRLLRDAGLRLVDVDAHVYADVGHSTFFLSAAESYAPLIVRSEMMAAEVVEKWIAELRRASEDGMFFAACNYYAYLASR